MEPDASIILVGVRGSGKRTLGLIAATALNWRFITEDLYFEKSTTKTRAAYMEAHGSHALYRKNVEVISSMLLTHRQRCVIECGWGSLTLEIHQLLQTLCATHPVIHITRSLKQIQSLLQLDQQQTFLFRRADEYHRDCSNYEFYNIQDSSDQSTTTDGQEPPQFSVFRLREAKAQFCSFLDSISKDRLRALSSQINRPLSTVSLLERKFTHVVPVLFSDLLARDPQFANIDFIEDAVELTIDTGSPHKMQDISEKVAAIRRSFGVPIIYNVASPEPVDEPTQKGPHIPSQIIRQGLRLAVDYLTVDLSLSDTKIEDIMSERRSTQIIGHCEISLDGKSIERAMEMYIRAANLGCDVARVIYIQSVHGMNTKLLDECLTTTRSLVSASFKSGPALITYGAGFTGCLSGQLSNTILTPVYHPQLNDCIAEPSCRLTTKEAMQTRFQRHMLEPLRLYLIGSVPLRVAPAMFKAALDATGLKFEYIAQDNIDAQGLDELAKDNLFGGASVTYGFKTIVAPYVDRRSEHATAIGAVNTLMPLRTIHPTTLPVQGLLVDRAMAGPIHNWYGDNTDWIGMTVSIQRNLSPRNAVRPNKTSGLVIGGGGMARAAIYTMLRLEVSKVLVFNPTAENPGLLPKHFNAWLESQGRDTQKVLPLNHAQDQWPPDTEHPTIIVSCPGSRAATTLDASNQGVPVQWLQSETGGVVLEMTYNPLMTPLLRQVQDLCTRLGRPWITVNGLEMLTEQGSVQFELLTGRRAPRQTMRTEALRAYHYEELLNHV
ncbi:uncharacterized protein Z520_07697 [Fonsecaea multimorphosa CBS 102226]|uniref:Quinate repressor protein n=1 Tax=Fonsecaea multimorphosa CBS 102226 TaxID=1442371 RepID=A0A0D2IHD5_9EURO|nr:uncharacterized protein Z520_07697 [Fonsecaea multimorphosa CBS 102226]KIX96431.1 hypothetical protein Z520_07697 [Fonsecaea multimorphosa CBS 102226]OAL22342.1 hypothetical protein AYO22_07386 [Fonsecaea multimorphosa]